MRQITGTAIAVATACVVGAVALANIPAAGHSAPPVTKKTRHAHPPAGLSPVEVASRYLSINLGAGTATVRRTSTGAKVATLHPPRGARFFGVGGGADDRTFVLATNRSSGELLYKVVLNQHGQPGPIVKLAIPPLPSHFGSCPAQIAGLATNLSQDTVAVSITSDCPDGRAGPSEILTARISTGRILATFHPGHGYPMFLSWTVTGSLVYDWSGQTAGIFLIPDATKSTSKTRLLVSNSDSVGGFSNANYPMVSPDGGNVFATVNRGSDTAIAAFQTRGNRRAALVTPVVHDPAQFCGPLWAESPGRKGLAACGNRNEFEIQNGKVTKLHRPWLLPNYPAPEAPLIAW
jgi:hypothetical protein